jgi:hypothetical protein|tara:strand:- start:32 stop:415 length:384 start_codon:yes stop_codon:yes gene_type:complete
MNIGEILDYMDGYRVTGEDGGIVIQDLKELVETGELKQTTYADLGEVKYYGVKEEHGPSQIELYVFENEEYKFICIEDTEVFVSGGGTCYSGSVEVYLKSNELDKTEVDEITIGDTNWIDITKAEAL